VDFVTCTQTSCDGTCFFTTGGEGGGSMAAGVGGGPAGAGGGAVGAGGAGTGGDTVGGVGAAGGEPVNEGMVIEGEGCSCEVVGSGDRDDSRRALALLGLGLVLWRRRRR
jgi:hypothetical protein